ncbi:MAG: electron transport complex subunit RsxC [Fretibacterium sp.]|nr:electron transport complex subunit RsxC [Fretibacterium sp.]
MKLPSFEGGVHPPDGKALTAEKAVELYQPQGGELIFPLLQHLGAPCSPAVKRGDRVLRGQKLADSDAFVSAPIFSSVSGTVKDIGPRMTIPGSLEECVVVENDGLYETGPDLLETLGLSRPAAPEEYLKVIRAAGIVGMGGACFPTHVKLAPPEGRVIRWFIVNGAECEPFLNCDNRLMLESPDILAEGLQLCLSLFPQAEGIVAIETNKPESIQTMSLELERLGDPRMRVAPQEVKYPQGAEKMLIRSVTGQEIPPGALPADVGCIIVNVRTLYQIHQALTLGTPVLDRIISVTGDVVVSPGNFCVPLGISVRELVERAGGFSEDPVKVLAGGPMMGISMRSLDVPIVKGTSGILALSERSALLPVESNCLRCGRCVEACPMRLVPSNLDHLVRLRDYTAFEQAGGMNCIECGCCTYNCPASRFLTQTCRDGKAAVTAERRKKGAPKK